MHVAGLSAGSAKSCRRTLAVVGMVLLSIAPVGAETLVFHAASSGGQTLDQGEGGGNPFASSLIEILNAPSIRLAELPATLQRLTGQKSGGFQKPDVPSAMSQHDWQLVPAAPGERRIALVMVVSDYTASGGATSLTGAKLDAERVAAALRRAGFETEMALDLALPEMRAKLSQFAARSRAHDAALVYTTGHGVEVNGTIYLLPGDYPVAARNTALETRALALPEIARSPSAGKVNLVLYAGCRDNPLGD